MHLPLLALLAALVFHPAFAKVTPPSTPAQTQQQAEELLEQGSYTNVDGQQVHRPAHTKSGKAPAGASAKCRDGSFSFSKHHRGTCSGHHGVTQWLN